MRIMNRQFPLETPQLQSFTDVTERVRAALAESGVRNGIVVVYSPHTTCSVFIQEDSYDETFTGTKYVMQDLLDVFDRIIPECRKEGQYLHPGPKCVDFSTNVVKEPLACTLNTDAHLRSSLMGRSETIPVVEGALQLGEFGSIYFADFDRTRPRQRIVQVQILGE